MRSSLLRLKTSLDLQLLRFMHSRAYRPILAAMMLSALLVAGISFADVVTTVTPASPLSPDDTAGLAKLILGAVVGKQWGVVISGIVLVIIGTVKHYVPETTKVGAWLHSKPGGWLTNFLTTGTLTLLTAFLAGQTFSFALVVATITTALSGAGLLELIRDVFMKTDPAPAQVAGAAAAEAPKTTLNG